MPDTKTRTITLTNRPPVKIREQEWPELACASYTDYDSQYEHQANRRWSGFVRLRVHSDGRAIVYARCWHASAIRGERDYDQHAGVLLAKDSTMESYIEAIRRVHATIRVVDVDHAQMWRLLADECIARLPAEEL